MAKVTVTFTKEFHQVIDWPDDELDLLNHDNLVYNCDHESSAARHTGETEVLQVQLNGEDHEF